MGGCIMETKYLQSEELTLLSFEESCRVTGGADANWDYTLAEYVGLGLGYGAKKLWRAFQFLSESLYSMSSNPKLLYQ